PTRSQCPHVRRTRRGPAFPPFGHLRRHRRAALGRNDALHQRPRPDPADRAIERPPRRKPHRDLPPARPRSDRDRLRHRRPAHRVSAAMHYPAFYDEAPRIAMRDPLAALLGAADDGLIDYGYADAVRLAGHSCPTVAGAYLMARTALRTLYPDQPAERGGICVRMPAAEDEGVTGVTAQVLTLITGAAAS